MNLKTSNKNNWGKKINLPLAGSVQVSEEGEIEVDEKCGNFLVEKGANWSIVAIVEDDIVEDDIVEDDIVEDDTDSKEKYKKMLKMSVTDLKDIAKSLKLNMVEVNKIKKKSDIIDYILKNTKS